MNKLKFIFKIILLIIIGLIIIKLLASTFKAVFILGLILFFIYLAWTIFKR